MTTDDIRQMCDFLDEQYDKDVEHFAIIVDRNEFSKDIKKLTKRTDLTEDHITEVMDQLTEVDMYVKYVDFINNVIDEYDEEF